MNQEELKAANREWAQLRTESENILARCDALGLRHALQTRGVLYGWALVGTERVIRTILEVIAEAFPIRWRLEYANATERVKYDIPRYTVIIEHLVYVNSEEDYSFEEVVASREMMVDALYSAVQAWVAVRRCRQCGCTDQFPCEDGCTWVAEALCSQCVATKEAD